LATLAVALAQAGGLRRFIETGTFLGDALPWAARQFEQVPCRPPCATWSPNTCSRFARKSAGATDSIVATI
jgi:hypothetical protein